MPSHDITFREEPRPSDAAAVRSIVDSTGFFRPDEVDVAVELVQERLAKGPASGYHFVFAERGGEVLGYTCYGPIACTLHSYDLFWIAVRNDARGMGLGKQLMERTESRIAEMGGQRVYAETSSTPRYEPTRGFYLRCGYIEAAFLEDFYAPGDGRVTYLKVVGQ